MWNTVRHLLEMIRFSHTLFALPFALLAAVMAWGAPTVSQQVQFRWVHLLGVLLAMVGARSAAMSFNRLVDRRIDAANERTRQRHLPSGKLSVSTVMVFTAASVGVYLLGTLLFLPNYLPVLVAGPVLAVLLGYSYAKRFTALAHFWLGLALALAPVCVWIALRGNEVLAAPADLLPATILGLAVLFWVSGFDIIYGCQDFEFDKRSRLYSIPVLLGLTGALRLAAGCHASMVVLLAILPFVYPLRGMEMGLGWLYGLAVVGIAGLLLYEHWLVRPDDLSRVNMAFFHVNAVVSLGLFLAATIDLMF